MGKWKIYAIDRMEEEGETSPEEVRDIIIETEGVEFNGKELYIDKNVSKVSQYYIYTEDLNLVKSIISKLVGWQYRVFPGTQHILEDDDGNMIIKEYHTRYINGKCETRMEVVEHEYNKKDSK